MKINKSMLKRCVLRWCLKVETVEIRRMSAGSWFHACGAAYESDLEPNVVLIRGMS